jgi:hypothetical protein
MFTDINTPANENAGTASIASANNEERTIRLSIKFPFLFHTPNARVRSGPTGVAD